jgi:hypothetical protein
MKRRKYNEKLARFLGRVYDTKASSAVYWNKLRKRASGWTPSGVWLVPGPSLRR